MTTDDLLVHKGNAARHGLKELRPNHLPGTRCVARTTVGGRSSVVVVDYTIR